MHNKLDTIFLLMLVFAADCESVCINKFLNLLLMVIKSLFLIISCKNGMILLLNKTTGSTALTCMAVQTQAHVSKEQKVMETEVSNLEAV